MIMSTKRSDNSILYMTIIYIITFSFLNFNVHNVFNIMIKMLIYILLFYITIKIIKYTDKTKSTYSEKYKCNIIETWNTYEPFLLVNHKIYVYKEDIIYLKEAFNKFDIFSQYVCRIIIYLYMILLCEVLIVSKSIYITILMCTICTRPLIKILIEIDKKLMKRLNNKFTREKNSNFKNLDFEEFYSELKKTDTI